MNSRSGWFRGHAWDARARAAFDERIKRVRPGYARARCFWLKAAALFYGKPRDAERRHAAIALLERGLLDAECDGQARAELLDNLGRYRLLVGQRSAGIAALRECIELGGPHFTRTPDAETILARRAREEGDDSLARCLYDRSLPIDVQWGGKSSYAQLLVNDGRMGAGNSVPIPAKAADEFVLYCAGFGRVAGTALDVRDFDLYSLAEIDRVFRFESELVRPYAPLRHDVEFLETRLIPQLGAYIGEIVCRQHGGRWLVESSLMRSRVLLQSRLVDPFLLSYEAVYYECSLELQVRQALHQR